MAKQLIFCEKPSVARDFANALSITGRKDGYFESDKYVVTWGFGHLCQLKEPEDYDPGLKKWSLATLPIFPKKFEYKIIPTAVKQFNIIKDLIHRADISSLVIASDCGREGELIARLTFALAGNKKPIYRFWTSEALTDNVIKKQMQNLKPAGEYNRIFQSALARQWADWLIGINASRAVSVKFNDLFSIGRVQTAVLALLVKREQEIKNFKPVPYFNITAIFERSNDTFKGIYFRQIFPKDEEEEEEQKDNQGITSKYAIIKKEDADNIVSEVLGQQGVVEKITSKVSSEKPPLLFSLTTLQQEANKLFGFSAQQTLDIAQSLYEKKLISYPRTESQHLDPQYAPQVKQILQKLATTEIKFSISKCLVDSKNKRVFDLSKLTDHSALIPQGIPKGGLNESEKKIYNLICMRFISAFYPVCKYKNTTVVVSVKGHNFEAKGKVLIDAGWKEVYGGLRDDVVLPELKEKEKVLAQSVQIVEKQTQPPQRYTDASLLEIMANAHKVITEEKLKKILKENAGIGTPATRAQMLKILQDRKYVIKQGKQFVPTEKAEFLINILKDEKVASPAYTALWEQELEKIAQGEVKDKQPFLEDVKQYIKEFVLRVSRKQQNYNNKPQAKIQPPSLGKCPECGSFVLAGEKTYYCSNYKQGCKFFIWVNALEKLGKSKITPEELSSLLSNKPTSVQLKSKAGNPYTALASLGKKGDFWRINIDFSSGFAGGKTNKESIKNQGKCPSI